MRSAGSSKHRVRAGSDDDASGAQRAPQRRSPRGAVFGLLASALAVLALACNPEGREKPKAPPCPPAPEPEHQSVVVGTIGKMHMVESRYALARLGDVFAAFKPDLVLVGVRVDAFREDHLEEASFEMTYAKHLAKARGVSVEPINWFREADLNAPPAALDPYDVVELERREAAILHAPQLYTFEQANGAELGERVLLATAAAARYRGGDPLTTRRHAWLEHLAADAVLRHGKPKRVLAFVDVLDRPVVDLVLRGVGYDARTPVEIVAKASEVLASGDVPSEVIEAYGAQLARAKGRVEQASGAERTFWEDRVRVLEIVVAKKAACCVTQATLAGK